MTETPDLAALAVAVGAAIRAARRAKHLHVTDCARAVGVHRNHWHRWEAGTRPVSLAQLVRVARVLDVSIAELVTPAAQTHSHVDIPTLKATLDAYEKHGGVDLPSHVLPEPYTGPWCGVGDHMTPTPRESR